MSSTLDPYTAIMPTPFGALGILCNEHAITRIDFLPPGTQTRTPNTPIAKKAVRELSTYLTHPNHTPNLPLAPAGSAFQQRVWAQIRAIPKGQTRTYGELARALASAPRAIGKACGANPYPLVIPCHRVVSAHTIGGFANARDGYLLQTKQWLLAHEQT